VSPDAQGLEGAQRRGEQSGGPFDPNRVTPWYAHTPASAPRCSAALPAIRDLLYSHGNAITRPLMVLAAWATAGTLALALAALRRPLDNSPPASPGTGFPKTRETSSLIACAEAGGRLAGHASRAASHATA
jgi:hypothetical protein